MAKLTVGKFTLGIGVIACLLWVSHTRSQQRQSESSTHRDSWVRGTLPGGYLRPAPLTSRKAISVDLSAEGLKLPVERNPQDGFDYPLFQRLPQDQILDGATERGRFLGFSGATRLGSSYRSRLPYESTQDLADVAGLVFDTPFRKLYSSVFRNRLGDSSSQVEGFKEEEMNPFTQLRMEAEAEPSSPPPANAPPQENTPPAKAAPAEPPNTPAPPVPVGSVPEARFVFLGDLDESGILSSMRVSRLSETKFMFPDGPKTFSLFVNPSALEHQRSFCVEDTNGDGLQDLLVTSRASLFGGVLLANGSGQFIVDDSFLTGYEPSVATVGAFKGSRREIISLNVRTGSVNIFRHQEPGYRFVKTTTLGFLPDYIGNAVELGSGEHYFIVAQQGQPGHAYRISEEGVLELSAKEIPAEPRVTQDSPGDGARTLLQVFQVGSYASVVLSNGNGQMFNVANLKVSRQVSLIIGDLNNDGAVDVAVASPAGK